MTPSRMSAEDWQRARIAWESEPTASYAQIAVSFGVSKALVGRKAKGDGWQKRLDASTAANRAHEIAASQFTHSAVQSPEQTSGVDASRAQIRPAPPEVPAGVPAEQARVAAEASAVGRRAEVETRHTQEHNAARNLLYSAMRTRDIEATKQAKLSIEALKVLHDLERRAWRLDAERTGQTPAIAVTVNRISKRGEHA